MKCVSRIGVSLAVVASCLTFVPSAPVQALSATTTTVSMSPNPAVVGQPVTLTATPSVPGSVTFTVDGQTVGTGTAVGARAASGAPARIWDTDQGNIRWMATDNLGNVYVSTYKESDCGGGKCQVKQFTPSGGLNYAPFESHNGGYIWPTGLAVDSSGNIFEAFFNGPAEDTIRKRTSIGATSTQFVPASAGIQRPCGMTVDANDNLYVASSINGNIYKVTPAGDVSTYVTDYDPVTGFGPCSPVINKTTGVLYYLKYTELPGQWNQRGVIMQVPAGGGTPTQLAATGCYFGNWIGHNHVHRHSVQLTIDQTTGYLYGQSCEVGNASTVTQISPTGNIIEYMGAWYESGFPSGGQHAGVGQNQTWALAVHDGFVYLGGNALGGAHMFKIGPGSYATTMTYTPTTTGMLNVGASFAPTNSGSFAASSGTGSLSVRPAAPSVPDLATSSDLGSSSSDDITSDNTPLIEVAGSGTSGNTITVTATRSGSTNVTCSYVLPSTGCSLGTLVDGTWSVTATESDPTAGASAASTALSVAIDTSAPTAPGVPYLASSSDTGSSNSDNKTNDNTPTLSATGGSTGDTITLSATNGTNTVSCTYVVGTATNCTLPTLSDGTWNISSTVTDPAGNSSTNPSTLSVSIDTDAVGGRIPDLDALSDTGVSSTDDITSDTTPTFSLTGQATGDVVVITASRPGVTDVTCTYTVGVASSCTLGALTDGEWSVVATITDLSGNTGSTTALPLTIATSASTPGVPDLLDASDTGASSTDNLTSDTTPSISAGSLPAGSSVTVTATKADGTTVSCTYVASTTVTSCDLPTLSDGAWSIASTVTDPAGNVSPASAALSISIDATTPSTPGVPDLLDASDTGASSTDNLTSDTTPSISAGSLPAGSSVTVTATKADGTTASCTYVASTSVSSCDLPTLSDGAWSIASTVTDPAGNVSPASAALSISIDAESSSSSGTLPQDIDRLDQKHLNFGSGWITATAHLKRNEVGRVSHVVFLIRNADGTTARTVRVKVSTKNRRVSTRLPQLINGQRIVMFVENDFGLSPSAPKRRNVVQGRTSRGRDTEGKPLLFGESLLVSRIIFDPASPVLDTRDLALLNRLARSLQGRAGLLLISGFARQNLIDDPKFLKNLSIHRARNVANYLSTKGVRAWIRFDGYGAVTTTPGTADDRRVEIRWSNAGRRVISAYAVRCPSFTAEICS